ncbi:hypothetical protein J3U68_02445 [Snodgrassella sp. B3882]|uniref:hypothetical protein n=1 Tax=Snodgrassella sp. B3882 TaxID=2818037 RepID=UPI0022699361|nr:hypothetical protein [Snodgrassella sp. B3882]MCX8744268.1 hypothetical protein [Snodgrassella sp. B3882]
MLSLWSAKYHRLNLTSLYAQNSKRAGDAVVRQPIIDSANSGQTDAIVPLSPIWADCTPLLCPQRWDIWPVYSVMHSSPILKHSLLARLAERVIERLEATVRIYSNCPPTSTQTEKSIIVACA